MRLKKEAEIKEIARCEIRAEIARAAAKGINILKQEESKDEFAEIRHAAAALTYFIESVAYKSNHKKQPPEAIAALPEAARVLKEIIETIHL